MKESLIGLLACMPNCFSFLCIICCNVPFMIISTGWLIPVEVMGEVVLAEAMEYLIFLSNRLEMTQLGEDSLVLIRCILVLQGV